MKAKSESLLIRCPPFFYPPFLKTESRWDDTGYDVTAYDVLTDFNEPNDTAAAGGVIEVLQFVFFFSTTSRQFTC